MRCNNCGWTNNPVGAMRCEKCNVILGGSVSSDKGANGSNRDANDVERNSSDHLKKTLKTGVSGLPYLDSPDEISKNQSASGNALGLVCTNCQYPLVMGAKKCPKCQEPVDCTGSDQAGIFQNPNTNQVQGRNFKQTVDPFAKVQSDFCILSPIISPNEPIRSNLKFVETTILNRAILAPDNNTITSKAQAELVFRDGRWYVKDMSEHQSTFIRREGEVELKDGDIIVFGNQRFKFNQ